MSVGFSLQTLTQEFEQTKERLRVVEDDIKKHTGRRNVPQSANFRNPRDAPPGLRSQLASRLDDGPFRGGRRSQGGAFSRLGRQLNAHEAQRMGQTNSPASGPAGPHQGSHPDKDAVRASGGVHGPGPESAPRTLKRERTEREPSEDGEIDDAPPRKVGLLSSIGASSVTVKGKSRSELLSEQSGDKNIKARNRRMFGMILGTLKSFEKEEITKRKEQVDKKVEKEQKVEEQKEREREEAIRLRRELLEEKRDKQVKLRQLQAKMELVGAFEAFSKRHSYMANFIHTSAKPPLMWLPKTMTPACEESLSRSRAKIEAIVAREGERIQLELERIEGIQRDSDGEMDGKENSCGTLPSSVAVVVNNDLKEAENSKENGKATEASLKESDFDDPAIKSIKIVIENDLAVKDGGVNGGGQDHGDSEDERGDEQDELMEQQHIEDPSVGADEGSDREEDSPERSQKADLDKQSKDEVQRSKSRSESPASDRTAEEPRGETRRTATESAVKGKLSPGSADPGETRESPRESVKRETPPGVSPVRKRSSPKKKQERGRSSSSTSSSSGRSSRSSSSSSSDSSSDSPRRPVRKGSPPTTAGGPPARKRSRSPVGRRSPPARNRRPSVSPVRTLGRRASRSPRRRSRSPRRRSPGQGSPVRRNEASPKRRSVSHRRSPSPRRRRRSSSPKRRSVSGGRRKPIRQRSGSRGPGRRGSPVRRRSRSRSPRRGPKRSRSPRRRR